MQKKPTEIRVTLASNIKKRRKLLGMSQEVLAEMAGISSTMVRDIETCRTWISDTTLTNLATALETDIFCLFMAESPNEGINNQTVLLELTRALKKIRKGFDYSAESVLKIWRQKAERPKKP
ncbi:MAG: helix-turn-helix domain-containing protein [Treponema sp.]|jgi:transcriptional regulator with XRE-family HTH domain|nr:helix-turn-helix domain-containing protein [Treponema sp.]